MGMAEARRISDLRFFCVAAGRLERARKSVSRAMPCGQDVDQAVALHMARSEWRANFCWIARA